VNPFLQGLDKAFSRVEAITDYLAATAMFLTMAIVGGEVVARYLLNSPLAWAFDVLTLYVMPAIFFFGLPGSYAKNAHIAVDIVVQHLAPLPLTVATLVARLGGIVLFAFLFYFGAGLTLEAYRSGDTFTGVLVFYVWPSALLVPIGCGLALLRMLVQFPEDLIALFSRGARPEGAKHGKERSFVE
jgi:TRAP-type C4-dicarboxylate transport system permease small subunit